MKKIGHYLYDEAGICPACGRIMRSVRYYEGEKDTTIKMETSGRYTHYSTSYKNIKETSEVMIHASVLYMNLRKKLRLLLRFFFSWLWNPIQSRQEEPTFALA